MGYGVLKEVLGPGAGSVRGIALGSLGTLLYWAVGGGEGDEDRCENHKDKASVFSGLINKNRGVHCVSSVG
jgi:hypothetical protein